VLPKFIPPVPVDAVDAPEEAPIDTRERKVFFDASSEPVDTPPEKDVK